MLEVRTVVENSREITDMTPLYERAFPDNERRSLLPLLRDQTKHGEVLAFYFQGRFCGFACMLCAGSLAHIIYLAVEESLRGCGIGSEILAVLTARYPGKRLIVDIEREDEQAANNAQRISRRRFYQKNGYMPSKVCYRWREEEYEMLVRGGTLTAPEFSAFWKAIRADNPELSNY